VDHDQRRELDDAAGRLFQFRMLAGLYGCPTIVKDEDRYSRVADPRGTSDQQLIAATRANPRFPTTKELVGSNDDRPTWTDEQRVASLPLFAEFQKKVDELEKKDR
jgi:hypothetical protein